MMMRKMTNTIFALLALCFVMISVPGTLAEGFSASTYVSEQFNEEDGLPTGEANAVLQTADGYLWFASYGGLTRYDGSAFIDFSDKLDTSSVRTIFEDSTGAVDRYK